MPGVHNVSEADNGSTLQAQVGDVIHLRLSENPTTGYRWAVLTGVQSVLSLRNDDFQQVVPGGIGSGGERIFRFEAINSGIVQLELALRREWEPSSAALKRYQLTVTVRG
jgi:inhibitor of cysteine peptidase